MCKLQVLIVVLVGAKWCQSRTVRKAASCVLVPIVTMDPDLVCIPAMVSFIPDTIGTPKIALLPCPLMFLSLVIVSLMDSIKRPCHAALGSAFVKRWRGN